MNSTMRLKRFSKLVTVGLTVSAGLAICFLAAGTTARADSVLANFESGTFSGWTLTGNAWSVGGAAGNSVVVNPAEGSYLARSGAPNGSGSLGEANTGVATSSAFQATFNTLSWFAAGWSGSTNNGLSYYQVLDSGFNEVARINAPQSDAWTILSLNLLTAGITPGGAFHFRAVDGMNNSNRQGYSWIAFDNLKLSGTPLAVPEPSAVFALIVGLGFLTVRRLLPKV